MAAFRSKLILEDDGGFPMTLYASLVYDSDQLTCEIIVPVGFKTDLASIPQFLWNLLPNVGKYDMAAVIHDYLYASGTAGGRSISRGDADRVLNEAMIVCGVPRFRRAVIYAGVRVGGWKPWGGYRAADRMTQPAA